MNVQPDTWFQFDQGYLKQIDGYLGTLKAKGNFIILGGCWAHKSGLRILVWAHKVPFFVFANF